MNFIKKTWKAIVAVIGAIIGLILLKDFFQKDLKADAKLSETKKEDAVIEEKKSTNNAEIKALESSIKEAQDKLVADSKLAVSSDSKAVEDYYNDEIEITPAEWEYVIKSIHTSDYYWQQINWTLEEAAKSMASTVTFTRDLEEGLQGAQRFLKDTPVLKIFFPFVKTPTNIAMEAMSRTPVLNFASPRFWSDFNAGGIQRDMAMARVTLGAGIIYGAGSYALDGRITGYGPMRDEDKKALEGTGWQQFSFVFNKSDL